MKRGQVEAAWLGRAECRSCGIRDLVLFADLTEPDFQLIHLPIDEVMIEPGASLYQAGDEGIAAFTIRQGLVKLVQYLPDGTQRIVRLLRSGAVVGLEVMLGQHYEHAAIAVQPTLLCRLPREVLDRLNRETPRLHRQLMNKWHDSVRLADEWLTGLNTGPARRRVARLLLHLLEGQSSDRIHLLVREDIGAILSITTETASRVVAEFKRGGVIAEVGQNVITCDREALDAIAQDG